MAVRRLAFAYCAILLASSGAHAESVEACSEQFWKRATTVATGHGADFEIEARQIGRTRCDCIFVNGKPKSCKATAVPEAEAVQEAVQEEDANAGRSMIRSTNFYAHRGYAHVFHAECVNVSGVMRCLNGYQKGDDYVVCETASRDRNIEIDRCWRGNDPLGRWTE